MERVQIRGLPEGDYKVGDIVYITKGYFDLSAGEIRSLEGFDGRHWWVKTKNYPKIYLHIGENFRHATKEEIAANEKKKETRKLLSIKTGDGLDVYEGDLVWWAYRVSLDSPWGWNNFTNNTKATVIKNESPVGDGNTWQVFHTKEAADTWIEEVNKPVAPVRKDGWKVGDKLPVEFLNLCTYYTDIHDIESATNVEDDDGYKWVDDRVVKTVSSKGWAEISSTFNLYLSPKHEYPEYEHYEKPKAESPIIVTKANAAVGIQVPVGWKPGDSWRHRDDTCGLSISVHPRDDDFNSYFVDFAENGTGWKSVNQINDFVKKGLWIINPKEEKQLQTIISKQTNTKQNENIKESSIGISITEQCFITSGSYKFNKAAYIPGDEERITKGQRRQGSTVRG